MTKLTINAKGQIALPNDVLAHLGLRPGEKIVLRKLRNGLIEVRAARRMGAITDLFGKLNRKHRRSLSIERVNKIAALGWAGKR